MSKIATIRPTEWLSMYTTYNPARTAEADLKVRVIKFLCRSGQLTCEHTIANEMMVGGYSRRVDLAVFGNITHAIEIKSHSDSLTRLAGQVSDYSKFFDKVTVVVAEKHLTRASKVLPKEVGLWVLEDNKIRKIRLGRKPLASDPVSLLRMINASELKKILTKHGLAKGVRTREQLDYFALKLSRRKLKSSITETLRERYLPTTKTFWLAVRDVQIQPSHLGYLSPNISARIQRQQAQEATRKTWESWRLNSSAHC